MLQDCQYFYFFYRSSCFVALPLTASLLGCEQTRPWGRLWGAVLWAGWTMAWAGCAARAQTAFLKWAAGEEVAAHHKGWQEKADAGLTAAPTASSPSGEEKKWSYLLSVCVLLFLWYCQMLCAKGFLEITYTVAQVEMWCLFKNWCNSKLREVRGKGGWWWEEPGTGRAVGQGSRRKLNH